MTMPNFLIIGAPKAGTSSIYAYLRQHPEVYMSPVKEPHFFMLNNQKADFQGPGDSDRFQLAVHRLEDYQRLFDGAQDEIAIGEASTTYLSSRTAADQIKRCIPNAKIIAILRNPVDAAYASFLHLVRDGDELQKSFSAALQAEKGRVEMNWDPIWHHTQRGFYYAQVERYYRLFGREQVKVYIYEDFKRNPQAAIRDMFTFLGVDEDFVPDTSTKYNVSKMPKSLALNRLLLKSNPLKETVKRLLPLSVRHRIADQIKRWNVADSQKPELPEADRAYLSQLFRADILKLQALIQQDLSLWLDTTAR